MKSMLMLFLLSLAVQSSQACVDVPVVWTIDATYTDPNTGSAMMSEISGDGVQTDGSGDTVYQSSNGAAQVTARLNICGTHPTYDATLQLTKGRWFNVNLAIQLGNDYQKYPPAYSFFNLSGGALLNIHNIMWCQKNGFPNGCTFYTRGGAEFTGPDGNTYHLKLENPNTVPDAYSIDSAGNCPYATSPLRVAFTPGALDPSGKDTYVVTPVLQGINSGTGWTAPPLNSGCPTATLPAGTWPAAASVLIQGTTGNSYNFGQYDTPFKFIIRNE